MITTELLKLIGTEPNEELVKKIEQHFDICRKYPKGISLDLIFNYIAAKHEVSLDDLKGKSHKRIFVLPRHEGIYLACMLGYKVTSVGHYLNKDHSTVINGRETVSGFTKVNKTYRAEIDKDLEFLKLCVENQ